jgi:hypothetical protein
METLICALFPKTEETGQNFGSACLLTKEANVHQFRRIASLSKTGQCCDESHHLARVPQFEKINVDQTYALAGNGRRMSLIRNSSERLRKILGYFWPGAALRRTFEKIKHCSFREKYTTC